MYVDKNLNFECLNQSITVSAREGNQLNQTDSAVTTLKDMSATQGKKKIKPILRLNGEETKRLKLQIPGISNCKIRINTQKGIQLMVFQSIYIT